jgi:acyl carrier protein
MSMSQAEIHDRIAEYISSQFLGDTEIAELEPDTPLLEWGVLNSMNTAMLLAFIRTELGVNVPPVMITGKRFHSPQTIADMVYELMTAQPA